MSSNLPNPKPEKVKSRWTRNSELEFGHGTENHNGDGRPADSPSTSTSHSPLSQNTSVNILKPEIEAIPKYDHLDENVYLFERKKNKSKKEMRRMVCNCILTKEERQRGVLGCLDDCLNRMLMIECGSRCLLGDHCANKRFQKKQIAKVEPFKTIKKGWGLRALQPIQAGQFIVEYVGEVLDHREFKTRVKRYSKENREHFYFMALKSDEIIDATVKGNVTRFINHSCDPNGETQKWTVNGELRIGFFARRNIEIGEEITFDYQFQRYGKKAQKCFCESTNCRGFIGSTETPDINIDGSLSTKYKVDSDEKTLEEEFEDLGLEEEIAKLTAGGGLRNRLQTLMLARLMVRAEDSSNRHKLIDVLRGTQELAYLRLFLDYHGLGLLWSWGYDLEDIYLKGDILETLAILPIPHRTALKDSKILDLVEKWSKQTENEAIRSKDNLSITAQLPLVVEPTSSSSPPQVSVKKEERRDEQDDPLGKEVKLEVIENGVSISPNQIKDHVSPKSSLVDDDTNSSTKLADKVKQSSVECEISVKIEEETKTAELPSAANSDIQVEIELGSEIEIKPELNGVVDTDAKPSGDGLESQSSDTKKTTEFGKARDVRSASTSSNSTVSGGATPVSTTTSIGDRIIGRRISVKSRGEVKDENNKENKAVKAIIRPIPDIRRLANKLLYAWKDLKEGFRIPRLERQKRLEDEKEADRKAFEMEERRAKGLPLTSEIDLKRGIDNSRNNALANILGLRKKLKRPQDEKRPPENTVNQTLHTPNSASSVPNNDSGGPTPPKMHKEAHRMQFEMDLMRKQYEEALSNYHKQMEQYRSMIQQQSQPLGPHNLQHQPNIPSILNSHQNIDISQPIGPISHLSPYRQGSAILSVTSGAGPPQPPPPPPALASMYGGDQSVYQGYQMVNDYSGTSVAQSYSSIPVYSDHNPSLPVGSPHINHVNISISTTSNTFFEEECSERKENYYNSDPTTASANSSHQSSRPCVNPLLIECTNSQDHNFMSDEKAVVQTDYGVEYVPIKEDSKRNPNTKITTSNTCKTTCSDSMFNNVYPAPGTYYLTKEGPCYFIPPLVDGRGQQIELNIFQDIPQPYPPSLTKESISTALPPNWRSTRDKDGNIYYYNRLTKTVQWELPSINMNNLTYDSGKLKLKEGVVVSNADSTSTPRDESLPKLSNCITIIPISTVATTTTVMAANRTRTPSTPLPSEDASPHILSQEPSLVNGESRTPNVAVNENSNECSGTPSHTLPGSYEPDPLITKPHINNFKDHANNSVITNCSSIMEINDGELIAANRRSRNERVEKRIKDRFKAEMSEHIKYCLNPYRKLDCSIGRILSNEHFKYVARKLTHFVMVKELKHCRQVQDLSCSETVKHKAKDYVKKYMAKQGPIYRPEPESNSIDEEQRLSPKEMEQESINDHSVDIYTSDP